MLALGISNSLEGYPKGEVLEFDSCQIGVKGQGLRGETLKAGGLA